MVCKTKGKKINIYNMYIHKKEGCETEEKITANYGYLFLAKCILIMLLLEIGVEPFCHQMCSIM